MSDNGLYSEAGELYGSSVNIRNQFKVSAMQRSGDWLQSIISRIRSVLGENRFRMAVERGSRRTFDEAMDAAFEELNHVKRRILDTPVLVQGDQDDSEREPGDSRESFNLTRREVEVLRLLARGLSDKEIAGELSISPRTAMTHVSNVLAKLKVNRRSAASAVGIKAGLIDDPDAEGKGR